MRHMNLMSNQLRRSMLTINMDKLIWTVTVFNIRTCCFSCWYSSNDVNVHLSGNCGEWIICFIYWIRSSYTPIIQNTYDDRKFHPGCGTFRLYQNQTVVVWFGSILLIHFSWFFFSFSSGKCLCLFFNENAANSQTKIKTRQTGIYQLRKLLLFAERPFNLILVVSLLHWALAFQNWFGVNSGWFFLQHFFPPSDVWTLVKNKRLSIIKAIIRWLIAVYYGLWFSPRFSTRKTTCAFSLRLFIQIE